ncbi:flagellar protein [Campylobacter concisus]|uniref:Flagellar protein n=1 Tax=Campylobacter concisus TaxID=199 RepID=A0A7S9X6N8_9BACT|nr:flagellar protein [Campylobacter concisus]QPI06735.1 flagellar protein [Campylobacter concisus]
MSSAWDYEANACSSDGKFSAKFEGCEVAMGAPTLGELRLFVNSEHYLNLKNELSNHAKISSVNQNLVKDGSTHKILLSERATACFLFSKDSKFLAFSEWSADKMQIIKVVRLADMSIKTDNKRKRVVEFISFDDGVLEILDSPIFMPKNFTLDIRTLFDDKI